MAKAIPSIAVVTGQEGKVALAAAVTLPVVSRCARPRDALGDRVVAGWSTRVVAGVVAPWPPPARAAG